MAQTEQKTRLHINVVRKNLKKVFLGYKESKFIFDFTESHNTKLQTLSFNVFYREGRCIILHFFSSNFSPKTVQTKQNRSSFDFLLGTESSLSQVRSEISRIINNHRYGSKIENKFYYKAKDIPIFTITESSKLEDNRGIDFFVLYKGISIPLQIKSSDYGQREHERFVNQSIPSLMYDPNLYRKRKKLTAVLLKICDAYLEGKIIHL